MLSLDIHKIDTDEAFNLNVIIQDTVLSRDYVRILKYGFAVLNPTIFPQQLLFDLIEFIELYYFCLETFSKVRKLKIKEKKRKRRNKDEEDEEKELLKMMKEKENNSFLEKNSDDEEDKNEHTGSAVSYSSDEFDFKERDVDVRNELKIVLDYEVIGKIIQVLTDFKNIKSSNLLRVISKLISRIVEANESWIFFNIDFLNIFHILMNDQEFRNNLFYRELHDTINKVLKQYFDLFKKNKLLIVESLFRFNNAMTRDDILNNYEEKVQTNEDYLYVRQDLDIEKERIYGEDVNYEGENLNDLFFSKKKEKKTGDGKEKEKDSEKKGKWTKNEDLLLIENYLKFKEIENFMDILEGLFVNKRAKDIKKRIKKLKIKKGEAKAMKRLKKLHKNEKEEGESNHENLFNIIIDLSDKCKDEQTKTNMDKTLSSLKQQLTTYRLRKNLCVDVKEDFQIIPKTEEEVEILKDNKFQNFIKNLGFVLPNKKQDEINMNLNKNNEENIIVEENEKNNEYWKLPANNNYEIEILIEKLDNFQKAITEQIVIPIPNKEIKFKKEIKLDSAAKKKNGENTKADKQSVKNSVRKSFANEDGPEENTYNGGFNFFNKEPSVKESKISKKESIYGKSEKPRTEKNEEEIAQPRRKKLKKARIQDEENMDF